MPRPDLPASLQSVALRCVSAAERLFIGQKRELRDYTNFLLLQYPLALGTAIHATPLIPALRACVPGARVAAAASGFAAAVLEGNPGLQRLLVTPNPIHDLRGAIRSLRAANWFDGEPFVALQTLGNERSKVTLAAMLSGAHTRVGFSVHPELTRAPLRFDPALSQINNNLRLLGALGHGTALLSAPARESEHGNLQEPQVFPGADHLAVARALLSESRIDEGKPVAIFITQTSVTQRKSWRPERFAAVATTLHADYGMQIVFVGTAGEAQAIDALRSGLRFPSASVAGRTGLLELSALMSLSDLAVSLDTGPMHLARAVKLPTVIIAPAWSPPLEWLPIHSPRARVLKNADFLSAPEEYIIDEVSVADVAIAAHDLLSAYPPLSDRATRRASA